MIWSAFLPQKRQVLIDIDTQSHFFRDQGPICIRNAQTILANIEKVMQWAQSERLLMISTLQVHISHAHYRRTRQEHRLSLSKPPGTLCSNYINLAPSDTMAWSSEVWQHYDQVIIQKRCFDPFEEPYADRILTELPADECILIGTPIEGAVKATALGFLRRQKEVTLITDAVGQLDAYQAQKAWDQLESKDIRCVRTEQLIGSHAPLHAHAHH
jgi:nicotinamidase-related amidase